LSIDLKVHIKIQNDFINIAAHELRTPIQPILGLSEILRSKIVSDGRNRVKDEQKILDAIIRNAEITATYRRYTGRYSN
jgi:signal transduction histidine kinase